MGSEVEREMERVVERLVGSEVEIYLGREAIRWERWDGGCEGERERTLTLSTLINNTTHTIIECCIYIYIYIFACMCIYAIFTLSSNKKSKNPIL